MFKNMKSYFSYLSILFLVLTLQGCKDEKQEAANHVSSNNHALMEGAKTKHKILTQYLSDGKLQGKYETALAIALEKVEKENSDSKTIRDLVKQFNIDMGINSTLFKSINEDYNSVMNHSAKRYNNLNPAPKDKIGEMRNFGLELSRISNAMNPNIYDEQFIDYINILAQISNNVNPVIVSDIDNNAALGSQFVGNPNYGEWVQDSSGNTSWSFWQTYGMIRLIDDVFDFPDRRYNRSYNSRYNYDVWHNTRNYSYYNDVYVQQHASPKTKTAHKKYTSNLSKKYKNTMKSNTVSAKQNTKISKSSTNKKFSSNVFAAKKAREQKNKNKKPSKPNLRNNKPNNNKPK